MELGDSGLSPVSGTAVNRDEEDSVSSRSGRGARHSFQTCVMHLGAFKKRPKRQLTIQECRAGGRDF